VNGADIHEDYYGVFIQNQVLRTGPKVVESSILAIAGDSMAGDAVEGVGEDLAAETIAVEFGQSASESFGDWVIHTFVAQAPTESSVQYSLEMEWHFVGVVLKCEQASQGPPQNEQGRDNISKEFVRSEVESGWILVQ